MLEFLAIAGAFVLLVYLSLFFKSPITINWKMHMIDKASSSLEAQEHIRQLFQKQKLSTFQRWWAGITVDGMVTNHQRNVAYEKSMHAIDEFMSDRKG
jgi:hypothetical protein